MNTFSFLSPQAKAEIAIQMVCMDAIEKGFIDLVAVMSAPEFDQQVKGYLDLMK